MKNGCYDILPSIGYAMPSVSACVEIAPPTFKEPTKEQKEQWRIEEKKANRKRFFKRCLFLFLSIIIVILGLGIQIALCLIPGVYSSGLYWITGWCTAVLIIVGILTLEGEMFY